MDLLFFYAWGVPCFSGFPLCKERGLFVLFVRVLAPVSVVYPLQEPVRRPSALADVPFAVGRRVPCISGFPFARSVSCVSGVPFAGVRAAALALAEVPFASGRPVSRSVGSACLL